MIKGKIFVISGPSGVGKSTIVGNVLKKSENVVLSVSATTRAMRAGEENGVNYYYKTTSEFETMRENDEFLEWAEFCGNYYGTPKEAVESRINQGLDVILEIETQGAMQIKKNCPESIFIFIAPPSIDELRLRITKRGTETNEIIDRRLLSAIGELRLAKEYDYFLVNNSIDETVENILTVIKAEHFKTERCLQNY